jgi:uncharacterized protein (DUF169 family)
MDELTRKLSEALEVNCRTATLPVGVKLARPGDSAPAKAKYPRAHIGRCLAVCQGMSIARNMGWTVAFGAADHACPLARIFMGHTRPDKFLQGHIAEFYQQDPECMRSMEASYSRWPLDSYSEIWLSPIGSCAFTPDLVVVYGFPAQILTLIQGANFGHGPGLNSVSSGRYGCSTWIAGVLQKGECTYMVPGPGERIFAGTQDHEMSFAAPYAHFARLIEGLNYVRRKGSYRYPVPNMGSLSEPRIPAKYFEIE